MARIVKMVQKILHCVMVVNLQKVACVCDYFKQQVVTDWDQTERTGEEGVAEDHRVRADRY